VSADFTDLEYAAVRWWQELPDDECPAFTACAQRVVNYLHGAVMVMTCHEDLRAAEYLQELLWFRMKQASDQRLREIELAMAMARRRWPRGAS
jgi:hypothetical protein